MKLNLNELMFEFVAAPVGGVLSFLIAKQLGAHWLWAAIVAVPGAILFQVTVGWFLFLLFKLFELFENPGK